MVLTKDFMIRKSPLALSVIRAARARVFALTPAGLNGPTMASVFVGHLDRIENLVRSRRAPFIAKVTRNGVSVLGEAFKDL